MRFMLQKHKDSYKHFKKKRKDARIGIWGWFFFFPALSTLLVSVWGYFWLKPQPSLSRKEARS